MKSYNVKSNAKRFARGIAAKYPGLLEAGEPIHATKTEWFPSVVVAGERFDEVPEDVRAACILANEEPEGGISVSLTGLEDEAEPEAINPDDRAEEILAMSPEERYETLSNSPVPRSIGYEEEAPGTVTVTKSRAVGASVISTADVAAIAASLPPRQLSSREEIDARRAERRAAIEADKASGARDRLGRKVEPEKISKKKTILDLVGREGGATQQELETATGWQRHTLRGYIAGTLRKILRKIGRDIECRRGKGDEPTLYVMVSVEGGA